MSDAQLQRLQELTQRVADLPDHRQDPEKAAMIDAALDALEAALNDKAAPADG